MAMAYFRIDADGAFFQAHADAQTGDISLLAGTSEADEKAEPIYISRNTAKMLARGLAGLAKKEETK